MTANKKTKKSHEDSEPRKIEETATPDPVVEAWLTAFYIENHLDYLAFPDHAAPPEQVQFMIQLNGEPRYYPCSDEMFEAIIERRQSAFLQRRYNKVLERILKLIEEKIGDPWQRSYLESLIVTKFKHETRDEIMIPSRLEKRLLNIFIKRTQIDDPFLFVKRARNRAAQQVLNDPRFRSTLDKIKEDQRVQLPDSLDRVKIMAEQLEFRRLLCASVEQRFWQDKIPTEISTQRLQKIFARPFTGNGAQKLQQFVGLDAEIQPVAPRKILWLADESGEVLFDLAIIMQLSRLGHKVIIAFKDGPLFTQPTFIDAQEDPVLSQALSTALPLTDRNLGKNELLQRLRSDHSVFTVSDGTSEKMNLLLASTTFARLFKEVDAIVSRGPNQRRRFFDTRFDFTNDIYSICAGKEGSVNILHRPKSEHAIKFSHAELEKRAQQIIEGMDAARKNGMRVLFYSGIIGSIPGKEDMAIDVMNHFITDLKKQLDMTHIINPSEHYEPGMDADDLMYMWEIVQRSGRIDIWRFQTYEDVERAFQLMSARVPPEWVGKDATYSTGCTKEMQIAQDVLRQHPEMQIIGPSKEKFIRRSEYGVGKLYDRRLDVVGGLSN